MTNIETLIKKYYKKEGENITASPKKTSAECYTNQYHKIEKMKANRKHRHNILTELLKETPFTLSYNQKEQIRYWIDLFNEDFKQFHRQASNETIILSFIMIQQKKANPRLTVENYTISEKYHLNTPTFELIQNRLIFQLMKTTPLTYSQSKYHMKEKYEKQDH